MKTIEQLRQQKQNIEKRLRGVKNRIDDIENSQVIPELRLKYEGKYFKYENRYDSSASWWMYFYVSKVKTAYHVDGIEFQKTIDGEITVKQSKDMCLSLLETECTKAEFDKNINKCVQLLNSYIV